MGASPAQAAGFLGDSDPGVRGHAEEVLGSIYPIVTQPSNILLGNWDSVWLFGKYV